MVKIRTFKAVRPKKEYAKEIASLPYDVYSEEEAREIINKNPKSFLAVDLPIATTDENCKKISQELNKIALKNFNKMKDLGYFYKEDRGKLYIYQLTMKGKSQNGLICTTSIDEYLEGIIKKHEYTRKEKEEDRINHVDTLDANTGPIFLTYKSNEEIKKIIERQIQKKPEVEFTSEDQVSHKIWTIDDEKTIDQIIFEFGKIDNLYIADGHHRAASAVKVGLKRRSKKINYTGEEEFNYFLSVLFPSDQVNVMAYNRVVKDLNDLSPKEFLEKMKDDFYIEEAPKSPYQPIEKGTFGMLLAKKWYKLKVKENSFKKDPISSLDVSILQNLVLDKILDIKDPRTDKRIDFVGGIRSLIELEKRTEEDMILAFSLFPTSLEELFDVADEGLIMPPKSTWFEPKPRSGLFIHELK